MPAMAATTALAGLITITAVFLPLPCLCQPRSGSYYYDACAPSTCGTVRITFPFTSSEPFCGLPGYRVSCLSSTPTLVLSGRTYQVRDIYPLECLITVSDAKLAGDLRSGDCGAVRGGAPPDARFAPLELPPWWSNVTSFVCPPGRRLPSDFDSAVVNYTGCRGSDSLYYFPNRNDSVAKAAAPCVEIPLPVGGAAIATADLHLVEELLGVLEEGFPLLWQNQTACWDCEAAGGRCGHDESTKQVVCYHCKENCRGGAGGSKKLPWKIITATGVPAGVLLMLMLVALLIKFREKAVPCCSSNLCNNRSRSHNDSVDVQEFIRTYRSSLISEYSYLDIKKMADGFKEKLGEGGCGAVYKGKLPNGQLIAVKTLEKSDNSGQDFVNEVATIGRIHHVNIIRLMGFCCDGSRRALIYEFMPNGSLGDLISKQDLRQHSGGPDLLDIAVGVARGIEYLHQGCDTRILHLDIKPHNVLLDSNFNPKISDFGLAKLYSRGDSAVSLTGARGTIGYIAPEFFLSNVGAVSDRSDVYSYGMLLLEMAVGRKRIRALETEDSSCNFYFPHWIYEQLDEWREMELSSSIEEEKLCNLRKMVMVGLWCIQTQPSHRPSITQVLEMLTGRVSNIDLPPKPTLCSMPRELHDRIPSSSVDSHGDTLFYTVKSSSWR